MRGLRPKNINYVEENGIGEADPFMLYIKLRKKIKRLPQNLYEIFSFCVM